MLTDPIADMLTRIRNGLRINLKQVEINASKICEGIAGVLKEEGYIKDFDRIDDGKQGILRVFLKYDPAGQPAITEIKRISKPGRRVYSSVEDLPMIMSGLGITVISTSKGIMSDKKCRQSKVSGEILCMVN